MGLLDRLRAITRKSPANGSVDVPCFTIQYTSRGADLHVDADSFSILREGRGSEEAQLQFTLLRFLAEQGHAQQFPNGFSMSEEAVSQLGSEEAEALGLPKFFEGAFKETILQHTNSNDFSFTVVPQIGEYPEAGYERRGALIEFRSHRNRLTAPLLSALKAIERHQSLPISKRTSTENVRLVATLQSAQHAHEEIVQEPAELAAGYPGNWPINLGHFENFETLVPENVRLTAESNVDGSLTLTPDLGVTADPHELDEYWHQVSETTEDGVIRYGSKLILLDDKVLSGVREVRKNRRVPADRVEAFLKAPGEVLDLENTDIELSFNVRVKGVGIVAPVSFAEASENGIQWIEAIEHTILKPETIRDVAVDDESLAAVESAVETARSADSDVLAFEDHLIDISDQPLVEKILNETRERVQASQRPAPVEPTASVQVGLIVDDALNEHDRLCKIIDEAAQNVDVDYSGITRSPFKHQEEGIRWLLARLRSSLNGPMEASDRVQGAILADDMGLGKTFMSLIAIREFIKHQKSTQGAVLPTLAVLPLSLIENWEDEIRQTFHESPFEDIVVLQSERELNRFKLQNRSRETQASSFNLDSEGFVDRKAIKLSLAVGEEYGENRLDRPGRLVLTTYEGLASYQLSLAQVDWGLVVFDESQALKNPDALRTRAAKGLKARFKLLATGTPVENSLRDFWSLMDTAQPGLLGSWPEFRRDWVPANSASDAEKLDKGLQLAEHVRPFMLRRNKEDNLPDLPVKTIYSGLSGSETESYRPELCQPMSKYQQHSYDAELAQHEVRKTKTQGAALATIQSLRRVSLHADAAGAGMMSASASPEDSARLQATLEILDQVSRKGEKAIVFVIDKKFQIRLAGWLRQRYGLPVDIVNGETKAFGGDASETRKGLIRRFEAVDGFNIIIMSPLAVGTGLTVTGANHAIHLERHWNPAKEAQATDRIYRIGQKRPVSVYLPLAHHPELTSFDEKLNQLLRNKTFIKDALMAPSSVSEAELEQSLGLR